MSVGTQVEGLVFHEENPLFLTGLKENMDREARREDGRELICVHSLKYNW